MSIEDIAKIIAKDIGSSGAIARSMAERIAGLHKALSPAVEAYISEKPVSFAYGEITLQTIIEKERCSTIEALFSMSALLENSELAARYKSMSFRKGCLEE